MRGGGGIRDEAVNLSEIQGKQGRPRCGRRLQNELMCAWLRLHETLDLELTPPDSMRLVSVYFGQATRAIRESHLGYTFELSPT